ncbi:MAG: endo-1,4-beta-xylanase, partial [Planctomycetota bacterium]
MVRFVFESAQPRHQANPPRGGYLVGKDHGPMPTVVRADGGALVADHNRSDAVSLVVEYDTPQAGPLMLRTCLLPGGDRTYLLPLELARHQIMMVIRKLEEWGLSNLSPSHEAMRRFEDARARFTDAATAGSGFASGEPSLDAFEAADESLRLAIEAGEALAREDAHRGRAGAPLKIGCTVAPASFSAADQRVIGERFDFITCPMRWAEVEADEGRYTFAPTDRCIEWAVRHARVPVVSGPVVELSEPAMPGWLGVWDHDYEQLRDFAYEHVKRVVTRYRRTISQWTATSCLSDNAAVPLSIDQMVDLTRVTVLAIRKLHPKARVVIELAYPFGDLVSVRRDRPGVNPRLFAELVLDAGVRIDGVAIRLVMGGEEAGARHRDLLAVAQLMDEFQTLERPVHVSALAAPSESIGPGDAGPRGDEAGAVDRQSAWIRDGVSVRLCHASDRTIGRAAITDT